jgi:hypothetical protein
MKAPQVALVVLCLALTIMVSCSKGNNATAPDVERHEQAFTDPSREIFGMDTLPEPPTTIGSFFHDIDLAQVCLVATVPPGQPYEDMRSCVAVSLNRTDEFDQPCKPVFRWLNSTTQAPEQLFYVAQRDIDNPANPADYAAVKCTAAWDPWGGILRPGTQGVTLEVLVCYQIRNRWLPGTQIPDANNLDWDLGVTAMQWYGDNLTGDWWEHQPNDRYDLFLPDQDVLNNDEHNPDIAYNYGNGDVYLTFSDTVIPSNQSSVEYIKYLWYKRSVNGVSAVKLAQSLDGHNGFTPSIDIGWMNAPGTTFVGIAYTSQYQGPSPAHNGFHICLTMRPAYTTQPVTAAIDWTTTMAVRNPDFSNLDAGEPSLDIMQDNTVRQTWAIAYTQVVGSDDFGPITRVFVADREGQTQNPVVHTQIDPVDPDPPQNQRPLADGMYPAIAFNSRTEQGSGNATLSLTFIGQESQTADLHPYCAWLVLNPITGAVTMPFRDSAATDDPPITGNFNMSDIPFICPGISTAIIPTGNDFYWAAWCNRTEMEPPPTEVRASYGFAG